MNRYGSLAASISICFLAGSALADGKSVYDASCGVCHMSGVAGSPKLGDKEAWVERIAQGDDVLLKHAIEGYQGKTGYMPAKGGFAHLSDDDVKAALEYMVQNSQ